MEVYSAHHPETVDELLQWPWRRFERFYDSFTRRRLAEQLDASKSAMVAALWANSNYDDDKGTRNQVIAEIERNYSEAVERVLDRDWEAKQQKADEEYENNPFFRKAREGVERLVAPDGIDPDATVQHVVDPDQA